MTHTIDDIKLMFLESNAPRSLWGMLEALGYSMIPPDVFEAYKRDDWVNLAREKDEDAHEQAIGSSWKNAISTKDQVMALTDVLMGAIERNVRKGEPGDASEANRLKSLASALKTIADVRLMMLVGLEKPDSVSGRDIGGSVAG